MSQELTGSEKGEQKRLLFVGYDENPLEEDLEIPTTLVETYEEGREVLNSENNFKGVISNFDPSDDEIEFLEEINLPWGIVSPEKATKDELKQGYESGAEFFREAEDDDTEEVVQEFYEEVKSQGVDVEAFSDPSEEDFKALIDNVGDSIFIVDEEKNLQYINTVGRDEMEEMPIESMQMNLDNWEQLGVIDEKMRNEMEEAYGEADDEGVGYASGSMHMPMRGEFPAHVTIVSLESGYAGVVSDVTELEEAKREAEEAKKRIMTLAQSVSHDIKNDLQVAAFLDVIDYSGLEEKDVERINKVKNSLESARKTAEKTQKMDEIVGETEREKVDLHQYVENTKEELNGLAEEKSINISYEAEDSVYVWAGSQVDSLVENIVENSIQHSEAENIDIYMESEDENLVLYVEDDGIGMPEPIQDDLLENGSVGMQIISYITDIYDVDLELSSEEGTTWELYFEKAEDN
jgi:two-component sensor histidine kinase/PAS domain-containing protein